MDTEKDTPDRSESAMTPEDKSEVATAFLEALTDGVEYGYGVISLINAVTDVSGNEIMDRKNFAFIKTEAGSFEHNSEVQDFVDLPEFTEHFANSLYSSNNGTSILLLAVFDYLKMELPHGTHELLKPEHVHQWIVTDGFLYPDTYCNTEWNGVNVQPGFEFLDENDLEEDYSEDGEDFELPDTSLAVPFVTSLISNAPDGNNVITVIFSDIDDGYNASSLCFHKSGENIIMEETLGAMMVIDISSTLASGGHTGIALRSYVDRSESDGFEYNDDIQEAQELRGWEISLTKGVYALSQEECLEAYCNDTETGETFTPEPNVSYCAAWDVPDV